MLEKPYLSEWVLEELSLLQPSGHAGTRNRILSPCSLSSALLTKLNILPAGKEISILSHSSVFTVQAKRVILERRGNNSITGTGIKCFPELFRHLKKETQEANLQNLSSAHN